MPLGEVGRGDDDQTWIIPIVGGLASDVYRVTWTAGGATGNYQFTVAGGTTDTTAVTTTQDPTATTAVGTATTVATTTTSEVASTGDGVAPPADDDTQVARALAVIARWISYLSLGAFAGACCSSSSRGRRVWSTC